MYVACHRERCGLYIKKKTNDNSIVQRLNLAILEVENENRI